MGKPDAPKPPDPRKTAAAQTGTNVASAISNAILQNPSQSTPYGNLDFTFGGTPDYSNVPEVETVTIPGQQGSGPGRVLAGTEGTRSPGTGGTSPVTEYLVGDSRFGSLDEANAYRDNQASGGETYSWTDPFTGETYTIPRISVSQTLTDDQQQMLDNNNQAGINMSQIAADQSARIGDLLDTPFNLDSLQDRVMFDPSQQPELQGSINPTMPLQNSIAGGGNIQTGVPGAQGYTSNVQSGTVQGNIANAGPISTNANLQGVRDVSSGANMPTVDFNRSDLGNIQTGFSSGPGVQYQTGDAGDITRTYGGDFSEERQRVEDALMERMNPQLDRRMGQLESRLASQGLRMGSEPYQDAMDDYYRSANDAQLGAILSAGQEQSRLNNMEAQRAGFENSAQQQAFNQLFNQQNAYNSAQAQNFGQNATQAQFANQAQAQGAGQTLQQDQMGMNAQQANADIARAFQGLGVNRDIAAGQQALQGAQFGNQAQAQQFGQNATQADFANNAQSQRFGQGMANANLNNATVSDQFSNNLSAGQFANNAQAQQFGQNAQQSQFGNDAANQEFQRMLAQAGFANNSAQQGYQNYLSGLNAQNSQRNSALEEAFAERNQPMNEITALLSGSQVQNPQFTNANISGIPTTDVAGLINQNYNQRMQNYQTQMAGRNDLFGGLLGLGGQLGGAYLGGV